MKKSKKSPAPMSLIEFSQKFGSEEQYREHLFVKRFSNGFICPKCGHDHGSKIVTRLLMLSTFASRTPPFGRPAFLPVRNAQNAISRYR